MTINRVETPSGHEIDPAAHVSALCDLEYSTRGSRLVIGANAMLDAFVKIKFAGGSGDVVIGRNTNLNSGVVIYSGHGVHIGAGVLVAANVVFAATNHEYTARDIPIREQGFRPSKGGIVVEDDVWIGAGSILLDGARVRRGAVIAAQSVIRGEVAAYTLVGGPHGRLLGRRGDASQGMTVASTAVISKFARIDLSTRGSRLIVEDGAFIDDHVKIGFAGGSGDIVIARDARVNAGCVIYSGHGVRIGESARISANTVIVGAEHAVADRTQSIWTQGFLPSRGGVDIGAGVWIGANSTLLDGAVIGQGAVVRSGSVVAGPLPPYSIAAGDPAAVVGNR